jgi:hypothetical protein
LQLVADRRQRQQQPRLPQTLLLLPLRLLLKPLLLRSCR